MKQLISTIHYHVEWKVSWVANSGFSCNVAIMNVIGCCLYNIAGVLLGCNRVRCSYCSWCLIVLPLFLALYVVCVCVRVCCNCKMRVLRLIICYYNYTDEAVDSGQTDGILHSQVHAGPPGGAIRRDGLLLWALQSRHSVLWVQGESKDREWCRGLSVVGIIYYLLVPSSLIA